MELGSKIRQLRMKAGITQEDLAKEMRVTYQAISKWENNVCTPDIGLLPKLSVFFGVTIDDLFDLTTEAKLARIVRMLEMERELPQDKFAETVEFLKGQLDNTEKKGKIYSLLAQLYHQRVLSDCETADLYARKSLMEEPGEKECHWIFQKTANGAICDWNAGNRSKLITFYKELVAANPEIGRNYLYLLDNLLADNRTAEAKQYLETYGELPNHTAFQIPIYEGKIALAEHDVVRAEEKFKEAEKRFPDNGGVLFEIAGYYARTCQYEKSAAYYEKSFALEKKPRYTDALAGMAAICEIQGNKQKAVECYDRILACLEEDYEITEGEPVRLAKIERDRLL